MDTIITEFLRQFLDEFSLRLVFSLFILFLCSQRAVEHFPFEDIFVFVFNGKQRLMMVKKRLMWWFALKMSLRLSNASIWECFILDILVYLPFFRSCFQGMILNEMKKKKEFIYIQKLSKQTHSQRHIHHSHTHTCYNVRNTTVSVIKKVVQCKCQIYSIYEDTTLTEFTFKFVYHLFVIHLWLSMQPIS